MKHIPVLLLAVAMGSGVVIAPGPNIYTDSGATGQTDRGCPTS